MGGEGDGSILEPCEGEDNPMMERSKSKDERGEGRGYWTKPCDFFISCLGYAVGLGNIWRFPYLCYKFKGGSFLIPYFLMLLLAGLPVFLLEISLGQYAGVGPIKIFGWMAPIARGLGFAVVCVGLFLAFFYNVVVSWSIWYLVSSLSPQGLSWSTCGHGYNTPSCFSKAQDSSCQAKSNNSVFWNNTCTSLDMLCRTHNMESPAKDLDSGNISQNNSCWNGTSFVQLEHIVERTSATAEYFERNVLGNRGNDWNNFGSLRWESVCCLGLAWLTVTVCLIKGVKSSGRVVYFTSLFPYFVLVLLAVRGSTLPGASEGISFYLSTDWSVLTTKDVWVEAASQVIFSLGPACGCVITLSSYNRFDRNCHFDAILIAMTNCVTSVFCGFVVFSILGYMAHETGKSVGDVVNNGPGLAFIVYPEVVTRIPFSQLWAAVFFLMLITLALGSIFGAFETVITALTDLWPVLRAFKPQVVLGTSGGLFLLGLPFCCNGGIHMFTLFNASAPSWNLLLFALLEVVLVSWVYGVDRFLDHFTDMDMKVGKAMRLYWRISWKFTTPLILTVLLVMAWSDFGHVGYKGVKYPMAVQVLGYLITGCTLVALPVIGFLEVLKRYPDTTELVGSLLKPTAHWGPNLYQDVHANGEATQAESSPTTWTEWFKMQT